jgi:ABC-2 type transport system permease protein
MKRYLLTLRRFWGASIAAEMEYRLNFIAAAASSGMTVAGSVFTLSLLYQRGYEPGGWTWHTALMVVGLFTMLEGVQAAMMNPNRMLISEAVREGTLDFVLLKPIDSQFWLSVRRLSLWGLPNVALGLGLVIYAISAGQVAVTISGAAVGAVLVLAGLLILYALGFALATTSIWFVKLYNITIAMSALLEAGRYPVQAYPWAYQVLFTFVLPVAFMTSVPAKALAGQIDTASVITALGLAVGMGLGARWFWRFALRSYTSASS